MSTPAAQISTPEFRCASSANAAKSAKLDLPIGQLHPTYYSPYIGSGRFGKIRSRVPRGTFHIGAKSGPVEPIRGPQIAS